MENTYMDRRAHKRAFFTLGEEIPLTITNTYDSTQKVPASLLSIGMGGLSFIAKKHEVDQFIIGDRIIIYSDQLPSPVHSFSDVEAVIVYIINIDVYARVSIGCKFIDINAKILEKVDELVKNRSEVLEK